MKHFIRVAIRFSEYRMWEVTESANVTYNAGQGNRQQRYRESEPSNGQL